MRKGGILQLLLFSVIWMSLIDGFYLSKLHMPSRLCFRLNDAVSSNGPHNPEKQIYSSPLSNVYESLNEKLKGTSVYFVGMMGCGKSATSEIFAKKLGYRRLDTDEIAEYMVSII